MVEIAKANGVNVYHYLTYLLEKMPSDRMSDEELELRAPWNENVKTEIQHRINNTDQSDVNCQGSPAAEKPGNFLLWLKFMRLLLLYLGRISEEGVFPLCWSPAELAGECGPAGR